MKRVRLKDLIELKTETISPKKNDNYFLYSLPSFDNNKNREYLKGGKIQSNKYKVPNRSILFNKLNVRFKRVWKIDNTDNNKICSTEFLPLVVDENKAYYNFCYYLLISENITNFLCNQNANTSGSHKRIDASMLLELEINLPPLETQQKIAKILSDIDDKIEILHQINDNLAELAKTIYDYWFVQFDFPDENGKPYKSSGGKMVYNNVLKREIPEGWEVDNIFNVASIQYGFPFSTEFFNENKIGVPVIRIRDIKDNQISNFSTEEKIDSKYIIKKGEILIGMDGNFHINYWANDNCYLNQRVVKIQGIELSNIYLKEQIEPYIKTREKSISRTTVGHLSDKDLRSINIIIPNNLIMIKINSFYNNTLNKFIENLQQIQHLQSLRDWLLPMLMNGQVSVE